MALTRALAFAVGLAIALLPVPAARADGPDGGVPSGLVEPIAITPTDVPLPPGAPPFDSPIVVRVKIVVAVDGSVTDVELLTRSLPVFDDVVVDAARGFRFQPARLNGQPIAVAIELTHTFMPPAPAVSDPDGGLPSTDAAPSIDAGPALVAVLAGKLVELGTGNAVAYAQLTAEVAGTAFTVASGADGSFRLALPEGHLTITVVASGYELFRQEEDLPAAVELVVTYYVERGRDNPYETIVVGQQRREEVSRVALRGPEIKQVPGTFGDPFRVIATLPGVASMVSLLPFPIVRGSSPSSTGFLLDGSRIPLLFHLLYGPSVVHPELIEEVQFFPGGAPVTYGGYTGGIVDGRTHHVRAGEELLDFDLSLLLAGGLARRPVKALGATMTLAGRYGYPGFLLSLATKEVSLSYWDYQFRLDGGTANRGWTVFAYGANDTLETVAPGADPDDPEPPLEPSLILGFHRLDLRYHHARGGIDGNYRVVAGVDRTVSGGSDISMKLIEPSAIFRYAHNRRLGITLGIEAAFHETAVDAADNSQEVEPGLETITGGLDQLHRASTFTEAHWRPSTDWLIRPGFRVDVMDDGDTTQTALDPRLTVRYRVKQRGRGKDEAKDVWLKGGIGIYHQPPRFVVPLPGLDTMPLKYGLLRSLQTSFGAEVPLGNRIGVTLEGFYNHMDPTIFDLTVNQQDVNREANGALLPTTTDPPDSNTDDVLDRLLAPQLGRAYGLELMIRREAQSGLYGWLSYTLSRAERKRDTGWAPYDFDRTHLLNLVAGLPLARNWDLGARFTYQSGKPATTTHGYNTARTDGYARIDVRIDKRALWKNWLLDFYVDIVNIALLPEEVAPGATIRYVLPTAGIRGRF